MPIPWGRIGRASLGALTLVVCSGCGGDRRASADAGQSTAPASGPASGAPKPTSSPSPTAAAATSNGQVPSGTPPTVPYRFLGDDDPGRPPRLVEVRTPSSGDASLPGSCSFEVGDKSSRLMCQTGSEVLWSQISKRTDAAALLSIGSTLVAVHYSPYATGAELATYDLRSGQPIHRLRLQGLGSIAHSEYVNRVELVALADGTVAVFGNESGGKYVEVVDVGAGRTISVRLAEEPQARTPPLPPPLAVPTTNEAWVDVKDAPIVAGGNGSARVVRAGQTSCRFYSLASPPGVSFAERLGFECKDAKGDVVLAEEHGHASADALNAVVGTVGGRPVLAVIRYSAIASGATLTLHDLASGTTSQVVQLVGLGPVSHSKYRNEARLAVRGPNVVVYGEESQGRYVEVRDLASGLLVGNVRR